MCVKIRASNDGVAEDRVSRCPPMFLIISGHYQLPRSYSGMVALCATAILKAGRARAGLRSRLRNAPLRGQPTMRFSDAAAYAFGSIVRKRVGSAQLSKNLTSLGISFINDTRMSRLYSSARVVTGKGL